MPRKTTLGDFAAGADTDDGDDGDESEPSGPTIPNRPPIECDCPTCSDSTITICSTESHRLLQIDYGELT